jgi:hypothetical protein
MKAAVEMDMFGCPNRCKHCWIGHSRNTHVSTEDFIWVAEQFRNYRRDGQSFFDGLMFSSWYREPDFGDNYKDLHNLENNLDDISYNRDERELASIWRLVRDPEYAPWLKSRNVNCVQLSLFGTEKNTDYFTGRKGAFGDCLKAVEVLLDAGIAPRIQMFPFKTNLGDFKILEELLRDLQLEEQVTDLGREFACFLNADFDPVGEGFSLEEVRISRSELFSLPSYFLGKTLKHFKAESFEKLWPTEEELLPLLLEDARPLNDNPLIVSFQVRSDFNVYPNCGENAEWWRLGNLRADGIDTVINTFLKHGNPGLRLNYDTPLKYLAAKYGDRYSDRLYDRTALGHRWIRLEVMGR